MELLAYTSVVIANPSDDSADAPDPAPVVHVCLDAEEALVVDARAGLSPAQMVERKLASLLGGHSLPVSHLMTSRRTSRNR
jgi:hypothetical protein